MPSLLSSPCCVLPLSCPLAFPHLPSPGERVRGLGAAQEGRSIPAGSCLAQPRIALGERGQGEVGAASGRGPRDPSGR